VIAGQLKAAAINATVDGVAASAWFTGAANGNFQERRPVRGRQGNGRAASTSSTRGVPRGTCP